MSTVFEWHERGQSLELHLEPGSLVRIHAHGEIPGTPAEVHVAALHELREALVETIGDPQRAELLETVHATEQQLGEAERDRDAEHERAERLEAELRAALVQLETHKSAGEIADRRTRGLERDLERMRRAFDELPEGLEVPS